MALWWIFVLPLVGGVLTPASHACLQGGIYYLSNCCNRDEISACFPGGCLVAIGCTVCSDTCWDLYSPGVATRPGAKPGELVGQLGWAVRPLVTAAYAAGVLGLGEPFSLGLLVGGLFSRELWPLPNTTCVRSCDFEIQSAAWQFWEEVKESMWTVEWALELPWYFWQGILSCGFVVMAIVVLLVLEQRLVMAILVVLLSGMALADVPVGRSAYGCQCHVDGSIEHVPGLTPGYRGNSSVVCSCPFGQTFWVPHLCHGFTWRHGRASGSWYNMPYHCPERVQGSLKLGCRWGSVQWWQHIGSETSIHELVPGSAVCSLYALGSTDRPHAWTDFLVQHGLPCVTCVLDRREPFCKDCVRDCWETTADKRLTFEACGIGGRVTSTLWAHTVTGGVESAVRTPPGEAPRHKSVYGFGVSEAFILHSTNYTVVELGGYWHAIACPYHPVATLLPRRMPGRPVNACLSATPRQNTLTAFSAWAPGGFYEPVFRECNWRSSLGVPVCRGYAYDAPAGRAGFIRVRGQWQQTDRGASMSHPKWLLTDFLAVLVLLMKLSEARLVPLVVIVLWWWFNREVSAAPRTIIHVNVTGSAPPMPTWKDPTIKVPTCPPNASDMGDAAWLWLCYGEQNGREVVNTVLKSTSKGARTVWGGLWAAWEKVRNLGNGLRWLAQVGDFLPVVDAAVSPDIVAAPLLGWAADQSWFTGLLAFLNVMVYWHNIGGARLAALVAGHLARGALPLVVLIAASISRHKCSVLGLRICFTVDEGSYEWADIWWAIAGVVSWGALTLGLVTYGGRQAKLRWYAVWCRLYQGLRRRVADSPIGVCGRNRLLGWLWMAAAWAYPTTVVDVVVILILLCGLLDCVDYVLETAIVTTVNPARAAVVLDALVGCRDWAAVRWFVDRLERRGVRLFAHMGHVTRTTAARLRELGMALEPVSVRPIDCEIVRDTARTLSCGDSVRGKCVVARRGDEVLIGALGGVDQLPPGFVPAAPVVVRSRGKGFFSVVKTSMTGKDEAEHQGSVVVLGTATTRSMGTCVAGVMYTTYHGSNARAMAGPVGPVNPRWWSPGDDVAVYPLPNGATCLEPCKCQPTSCWVIRNDGALCHGTLSKTVELDLPAEVSDFRGSSGSPVLCDEGHAIGMLVAVLHRGNRVTGVRFTKPWETLPQEAKAAQEAPPVPGRSGYKEAPLFLPTGSGKSTRVPNEYAKAGHKVLVLNPSIATTRAMGPYMEKLAGKHPSVYCGHDATAYSRTTDSNLTYCTYGRFLANPRRYLKGMDVVICDECHVTDPVAVLGMGKARMLARECRVRLLLFATATPPGVPMTPHESIREEALGVDGEVTFYGHKLPISRYTTGRHIFFCHSKLECNRLAAALTGAGCQAVTYYRGGENPIPDGDVCVAATDALSTGYTGNFDTVTDCGLVVEEVVEVTLDPTITVSLRTVPAPAELRMQRRGRCGRGKAGTYYHAISGSAPAGTIRSGVLWSAVEAGLVWYNMEPDVTADVLKVFDQCPYTGAVTASIGEAVNFFAGLSQFKSNPHVSWAKSKNHQWPLLVGVQRMMCQEAEAAGPAEGPEWRGLQGKNPVPLLCRWGAQVPDKLAPHHIVDDLQARLGVAEGYSPCYAGPILLVGLAVAGGAILAHWTGNLVVVTSWKVNGGGNPLLEQHWRGVPTSTPLPAVQVPPKDGKTADEGEQAPADARVNVEAVELLETSCGWGAVSSAFGHIGGMAKTAATHASQVAGSAAAHADALWQQWSAGQFVAPTVVAAHESAPSLMQTLDRGFTTVWDNVFASGKNIMVALAAAYGARRNPPIAVGASFLLGLQASSLLHVRLAAALLLGSAGTMLGDPATGLSMAGAYFAGGSMTASWVNVIVAVIGGWEGAVNAASLVFDLLAGKAEPKDCWCILSCLASPGASVAGVALGLLLWSMKRGVGDEWVNRLLTLLPRSSVIPDDYFVKTEYVDRVSGILRKLSLTRWLFTLVQKPEIDSETVCGSMIYDFLDYLVRTGRALLRKVKTILPRFALPLVSCEAGWTGGWVGTGHLEARCSCGCVVTGEIIDGKLEAHYSSILCANYLLGGVPVGVMGSAGGAVPDVGTEGRQTYQIGPKGWLEVEWNGRTVVVVATNEFHLSASAVRRAVRGPVMYVDNRAVHWDCPVYRPQMVYRAGQMVAVDGERRRLPFTLTVGPIAKPERADDPDMPPLEPTEDEELECARKKAIEAIASCLPEKDEAAALAALNALEEAAASLLPHIPVIMGDQCDHPDPEEVELQIDTATWQALSTYMPAEVELPPPPEIPDDVEDAGDASEAETCSFESISLSDSESDTASTSPLLPVASKLPKAARGALRRMFGGAKKVVHFRQCCCDSRSASKAFPLGVSVKEAAAALGFDLPNHRFVDVFGGVIQPEDTMCTVVGTDIHVTCEMRDEVTVSYSYVWSGAPLGCGRHVPPPMTRPIGTHLTCDTTKVYVTDPDRAAERAAKVTLWRPKRNYDKTYQRVVDEAKAVAGKTKSHGWSYDEAIARVRPKAGLGYGSTVSVPALKTPAGREAVNATINKIRNGIEVPFTFTCKREVFFTNTTRKPPRFICHPPLDFRVAEKMILGDPGVVAKAILGKAYAFQYTPNQKVKRLVEMWQEKQHPRCITVDASCFDSTITEEDMRVECDIFSLASDQPDLVRALSEYYIAGPMVTPDGVPIGYRRCRASGVLTTSSGNSITCYLKVKAACLRVGLQQPEFLIAGDDCLIVYEDDGKDYTTVLKEALGDYGYRCEPKAHASLDTAETCSAYLAECNAGGERRWWMSCDMRKPLARAAFEYSDPIASALGTILLYPWHPITRYVLIPHVLIMAFRGGGTPDELVACQVAGNTYRFPLKLLPQILVSLHGPACLRVTTDSTKTRMEAGSALRDLGMKTLPYYRKRAGTVRTRLLRGGQGWGRLARALLWHPGLKEHPPDVRALPGFKFLTPYDHDDVVVRVTKSTWWTRLRSFLACLFVLGVSLV
uniref:Genome polyprotein n=14 Tax=Flaviviridae TaxID=11050 RepID=M9ZU40_9FLAV|nr:polyprotein [Bat pegivirus]